MSRGKLVAPNLDDRNWRDIVDQAKALIPRYAPEWTDHNPSDLGISLIELFAWIAESMIYRLNRVPEKNYIAFLNLLGITRDPATPASTMATFRCVPGSAPIEIPKGYQVGTRQTESEDAVVFETDRRFRLLPINLERALLLEWNGDQRSYREMTSAVAGTPLSGKSLSIAESESVLILLAFDAPTSETMALGVELFQPVSQSQLQISWRYSFAAEDPENWPECSVIDDGSEGFKRNGNVLLEVPDTWTEQAPKSWLQAAADDTVKSDSSARYWVGIRISNATGAAAEDNGFAMDPGSVDLGIKHILFNSVKVTNALTIPQPEILGVSNGEPFQMFELQNRPLFKQPATQEPYAHLAIQVREDLGNGRYGEWVDWEFSDDLPPGPGNYYRLDPVTGTIYFGNYHPSLAVDGHGTIPSANSEIRAASYRYVVAGTRGNVPAASVQVIRTPVEGVAAVTNLQTAVGGNDEEAIEDTKRRAPEVLRNRYRAITTDDYEYLAREASTEVGKVRCLVPRLFNRYDGIGSGAAVGDAWSYGGLDRNIGSINLILLPRTAPPSTEARPIPSETLLREVSDYLQQRIPVTTKLYVTGPRYIPINVVAEIRIWGRAFDNGLVRREDYQEQVGNDILAKVHEFLHPLRGGEDGRGWEVGQEITISSLFETIQPDSEIGFIADLKLVAEEPLYQPTERPHSIGEALVRVPVADYELICSGSNHQVSVERLR